MDGAIARRLDALAGRGWRLRTVEARTPIPPEVAARYAWAPGEVLALIEHLEQAVAPGEKSWLLSARDFRGESSSAWARNAWERLSLDAAGKDVAWQREITAFWDAHLPIAMSVSSCYAHCAIERGSSAVVIGAEPEFEETSQLAANLAEFLDQLLTGHRRDAPRADANDQSSPCSASPFAEAWSESSAV